jgi:hypothetical protein
MKESFFIIIIIKLFSTFYENLVTRIDDDECFLYIYTINVTLTLHNLSSLEH